MNLELLAPELSLVAAAVAVILLDLFIQRKGLLTVISIAGLLVSAGFTIATHGAKRRDRYARLHEEPETGRADEY